MRPDFPQAARTQLRVIGALMLRELHTRFGRHNLGYLWLVGEPFILSVGVVVIHFYTHTDVPFIVRPQL